MKRQLLLVSLLTGLSQLAAFFKLWFTAHVFGVSSELDGYNLALIAPTLISGVLAGLLQTGLFPVRSKIHQENIPTKVESFERTVWWMYAALSTFLAVALFALSGWLGQVVVPEQQTATLVAFMTVMPIAACLVAIGMVTDCTGYILAMRGSFLTVAGAPIANGVLGGLVLALWPDQGLSSLIWGTVGGAILQLFICVYGLNLTSVRLFGPMWWREHHAFKEIGALGAWVLPGVVFSNLAVSLPPVWAAGFGEGAVSAFGYASRLHSSAVHLLVMASSTLILARFSELVASGNTIEVTRLLRNATLTSIALGAIAVLCVAGAGEFVLRLLFSGKFDDAAAEQVTSLWTLLSFGLGFSLLGNVFAKLWQAQSRPKLLSVMAGASFITLCTSFLLLKDIADDQSIAAALALSNLSVVLLGFRFLKAPAASA
jgi:peptidoglycan biosynthesis protein MviN/MurJ (putative lipid II flippase)